MPALPHATVDLSVVALAKAYVDKSITPAQIINIVYDRIEAYPDQAVWISLTPRAAALKQAEALDMSLPLAGIPFAVKDNIDAVGHMTTAACPAYAYTPQENSFVVQRLLDAGAILIGKTNLDQFATGLNGTRSPYGAPHCVFDAGYISGGSSSGSAVAVAAGLVSFALGTDTAGSGRVPAAFNNIVGIKPSKGLLSTRGVVPACASLDCVSIFAGSCADGDVVRRIAEAYDPLNIWSREEAKEKPARPLSKKPTLGILAKKDREFYGNDETGTLYEGAIEQAKTLGWPVQEFDFQPLHEAALLLYAGPWVAERIAAVGEFINKNRNACDPIVAEIIADAPDHSAVDAFTAQYRLQELRRQTQAIWNQIDALLLPTAPTQYRIEEMRAAPITYNAHLGHYTNFVNLLDLAGIAIPAGFYKMNGLAFGVTMLAPAFYDEALLQWGGQLHHKFNLTIGNTGWQVPPFEAAQFEEREETPAGMVDLAVVGAHLTGMPLNHQLTERGGQLIKTTKTAPDYKLFALKHTVPKKPGLVREAGFVGKGLIVEIWRLTEADFGSFTKEVPMPLAIGNLTLADGSQIKGFVCEGHAINDAEDITHYGGWRAYIEAG